MAGILDNPVSANPVLQVDPNATNFHAVGPGILGNMTPLTMRWRNMVRGQDRMNAEASDAARLQQSGQPLDAYQSQLMATPMGQWLLGRQQQLNSPEAWHNRAMASLPGAQFNQQGQLSNAAEMLPKYADFLRNRIANPLSDQSRAIDQATLSDVLSRMQPSPKQQTNSLLGRILGMGQ